MSTVNVLAEKPTLSVIIPVYNGREYLSEAIDSLLRQTAIPDEIIIIDDGSTDGTDQLIADYCAAHSFIRLIRNARGGVSAARNKGLDIATGQFIYFMDADDYVGPTLFADFIREKQACPDLELFGFSAKMFPDLPVEKRTYENAHGRATVGLFKGGTQTLQQLLDTESAHRVLWSSVISRELINRSGSVFLPIQNHEDAPFMFNLYLHARCLFLTANAYYFKRYSLGSLSVATRDFSWVKNYFIAREGTEKAILASGILVDNKLVDYYYSPVMGGCLAMVRKHDMAVPKEYQPAFSSLVRKMTRNNLKFSIIWYCHPLYTSLTWCKRKLSGFSMT
ncbi:glycosyltransferase [Pantoea sp. BAV 3049]|uniref:glycosyltransferase family 2 protein n=1 Tax=Pantoea sp. BAV 3049 TaxID=2654188 RepID=UPI00131CB554|nr:glycosyltransferase [Pantoea sp. BAV 3049]